MTVQESVPLAELTTFKVGGAARYVIDCESESDIRDALAFAEEKKLPAYPLGEGSNILASDTGYAGVIIRPRLLRASFSDDGEGVVAIVEAGVSWDALVHAASERALWGIENLAGIPGTVGAAPVQNIGAYGAELADTLLWVEVLDPATGEVARMSKEACGFGYRTSIFKREPGNIIVRVALRLSTGGAPQTGYADLARLVEAGEPLATPAQIADAVRGIRAKKFPDLVQFGTAGSFFKNPFVSEATYAALKERYPEMPGFRAGSEVKIPLAWILDRVLSLRGFAGDHTRLFEAQPLVIVAEAGATAGDVRSLAQEVEKRVSVATGIALEWEVRTLQ